MISHCSWCWNMEYSHFKLQDLISRNNVLAEKQTGGLEITSKRDFKPIMFKAQLSCLK